MIYIIAIINLIYINKLYRASVFGILIQMQLFHNLINKSSVFCMVTQNVRDLLYQFLRNCLSQNLPRPSLSVKS
jgi:hypothetical protein